MDNTLQTGPGIFPIFLCLSWDGAEQWVVPRSIGFCQRESFTTIDRICQTVEKYTKEQEARITVEIETLTRLKLQWISYTRDIEKEAIVL